jgi:kynureninase
MHKQAMTLITLPESRAEAEALDASDPLARCRDTFALPEGVTYLVGHSLGPATMSALRNLRAASEGAWVDDRVGAWNSAGWIQLAEDVGKRLARLVGAKAGEVVVCDSVSVNLFKLAASALPWARTRRLVVESDEFPTDQYILEGLSGLTGVDLVRVAPGEGVAQLDGGVLVKSLVNYRSSEVADMADDEASAKDCGGVIVWDLSHATGVLDVKLNTAGARFAAGCTYKYLNGGPGAPAFIYARGDVAEQSSSPLPGWMGHAAPFEFTSQYQAKVGAARFASGTPPILSLAALNGALDVFDNVSMTDVQAKARALGQMCLMMAEGMGLDIASPLDPARRGGHVSVCHPDGYPLVRALSDWGIEADFRTPYTIRFGLSPLFLSYAEIWDAMSELAEIVETRSWDTEAYREKAIVT